MKTTLFYFTGTGNSLKVARDLAEELGSTELVPIARLMHQDSVSAPASQRVGIVCPVYIWGLPLIVQDFASKLVFEESTYTFGLVTYGGFPAATLTQLDKLLRPKGLSAGFGLHLPGNYTPMYGALSKKKQQRLFAKAKVKLKYIAGVIRGGRREDNETNCFLINLIFSGLIHTLNAPRIPHADRGFRVGEKCNSCGICTQVCPVNNIKMEDEQPQWQHHCQQCLACLHWCPQQAIELGRWTPGRKRYRHPEIKIDDIIRASASYSRGSLPV